MITLPSVLQKVMESNNLAGLKPFAYLFRNKWVVPDESESGEGTSAHYELDTTPIDISEFIVKPNTLSMTLDVNEVAQYNANNVTITLADTDNRFVEGTKNSYFPAGYQIYGSRVVLYYGLDSTNRTSIFTGVIKDLPTYKPEKYQVDLKLVSPLEMLKDIEAKDFSDKVTGEELHYEHQDDDSHRVYSTAGTGVGGFDAVYADDDKLFEGVDYEVSQTNQYGISALVTIINDNYQNATITADYYTWKTGLTVEQIVAGLVALAGYDSTNTDIRNVVWNTAVRTSAVPTDLFALGYKKQNGVYNYTGAGSYSYGTNLPPMGTFINDWDNNDVIKSTTVFPTNFTYELQIAATPQLALGVAGQTTFRVGGTDEYFMLSSAWVGTVTCVYVENGLGVSNFNITTTSDNKIKIVKDGTNYYFYGNASDTLQQTIVSDMDLNVDNNVRMMNGNYKNSYPILYSQKLTDTATGVSLDFDGIACQFTSQNSTTFVNVSADKSEGTSTSLLRYRTSSDGSTFTQWSDTDINSTIGEEGTVLQFVLGTTTPDNPTDFSNVLVYYLSSILLLQLVNLSGKTVLEALQDFALISGYEFGVNRNGVFFFRPRVQSTNPIYTLGVDELVKIDTVKRNLSDFFTKLTLTFAQVPLEFYANTGTRPTPVDKYGVINKEIDKPDIVNYDNPELAQAIGPQLLEVYSALPNMIQAVGKLNLALELADIVQVDRNYNLVQPDSASDYDKYVNQQTYYRACKITGMNYNFEKKQITYTLRDVSNSNNVPYVSAYGFVYSLPIRLGTRK